MKLAVYLQRSQSGDRYLGTAEQALEMTTIKARGGSWIMGDRVGSLEPGKRPTLPSSGAINCTWCPMRCWSATWSTPV